MIDELVFQYSKFSKGHKSAKNIGRNIVLFTLHIVRSCFIFVQSFMKISKRISELLSGHYFQYSDFKGELFRKNVGGVMLLSGHNF